MEVVLTRLRDFSCREASFEDYKAAVIFREQPLTEETYRKQREKCVRAGRLDIESALAWLRRELVRCKTCRECMFAWSKLENEKINIP